MSEQETAGEMCERIFPRRRALLIISVELDDVPGMFHEAQDHETVLQSHLGGTHGIYPHYHPVVKLIDEQDIIDVMSEIYNKGWEDQAGRCNMSGCGCHHHDFEGEAWMNQLRSALFKGEVPLERE